MFLFFADPKKNDDNRGIAWPSVAEWVPGRRLKKLVSIVLWIVACLVTFYTMVVYWTHSPNDTRLTEEFWDRRIMTPGMGSVALVFICHDREEFFRESLASVLKARGAENLNIVVSMDYPPFFDRIKGVVAEFADHPAVQRIVTLENVMPLGKVFHTSDDRITFHHRQILNDMFVRMQFDYAILLESDLIVSADFFEYMIKVGPLLDPKNPSSESLFCVSGWNDNGFNSFKLREDRLYRTDVFPGLGWMLHRSMWAKILRHEWPTRFGNYAYDIWLRDEASTRRRDCIAPEVSRTHHISTYGSHVNGDGHLTYAAMTFASGDVRISDAEVSIVADMHRAEQRIKFERIRNSTIHSMAQVEKVGIPKNANIVIIVNGAKQRTWFDTLIGHTPELVRAVKLFGLFDMRSCHRGLLSFTLGEQHSFTNVTLVRNRHTDYWGISPLH